MLKRTPSLFKKILLGIMLPMLTFALLFSGIIYFFSGYLIDEYVIPSFEETLSAHMDMFTDDVDSDLIAAAHSGDTAALTELQAQLNAYKDYTGVENAYILGQEGSDEYIISLSDYEETMESYPFSPEMHAAMEGTPSMSEIYEDEFGTFKSFFMPVSGTDAIYGIDEDASFINQAYTIILIISLLLGAGMIAASMIISLFITRKISKPVSAMTVHAEKVAKGDLSVEDIKTESKDELGQLAHHFNQMVADLREMIQQVDDQATQVASTSEELSASSEETSVSVNQVTETIQMIASSSNDQQSRMEALNETSQALSEEMNAVTSEAVSTADISEKTSRAAKEGVSSIEKALSQMTQINDHVSESADVVTKLQEDSRAIGEIVTIITSIADQTNLLALNASIEAARAGENGKGFAVVADEVRKLAEESGDAANQIKQKIEQVQEQAVTSVEVMTKGYQAVKEGSSAVNEASHSFALIEQSAEESSVKVHGIQEAIKRMDAALSENVETIAELAGLANNVSGNIQSVSATSEEQTAIMQEIASASDSLSKMAEHLQKSIQRFEM
ncbi:methyl-accepting chemotaxis protein [Salipaludibacillus aurantiacus]|uniref:Methyl-accepting chemotaxis protein n=1 Tax=Salipaludibacillus aurantiacus TaxID=1601833 RepID=A0A1H9X1T8_9BACI|nr:HAMP domain-containing methyl-accepting chemotaxis protein [Salipaludibacillus aurantiacus]SES40075.1 methyl-accepting chemotaxis protein [Salipaludibacillus aurantiacus]